MKEKMRKRIKRQLAFLMAVIMVFTMGVSFPSMAESVKAASTVAINPYSANKVVTYKPGSKASRVTDTISIIGCTKASQIKKLKSSNTSIVKVAAKDGYIQVSFGKKSGKVKITCTVKGKNLSTYYTVKRYSNPLSTFKIGSKSFVSKFSRDMTYRQKSSFKSQTLNLKGKSGWKIRSVSVYNGNTTQHYTVNKTSFSKKITLSSDFSYVGVYLYNSKTKVSEYILFQKTKYA